MIPPPEILGRQNDSPLGAGANRIVGIGFVAERIIGSGTDVVESTAPINVQLNHASRWKVELGPLKAGGPSEITVAGMNEIDKEVRL
jgi:hypothetical protein